jgi:ABC-type branched-subunit amino acid transport system permease subunit
MGPVLGASILTILPEIARPLREFVPFLFAGILMLVIFFFPGGMAGLWGRLRVMAIGLIGKRVSHA